MMKLEDECAEIIQYVDIVWWYNDRGINHVIQKSRAEICPISWLGKVQYLLGTGTMTGQNKIDREQWPNDNTDDMA